MESCRGRKHGQFIEISAATGRNRLLQSCRGRKRGQFGLNSYATGLNSPLQSCRGREFVSLGPPHSNMSKKQLPNIMIINELLPSSCPRRNRKKDWRKVWAEGLDKRPGHDEYACRAILFAKLARGNIRSVCLGGRCPCAKPRNRLMAHNFMKSIADYQYNTEAAGAPVWRKDS